MTVEIVAALACHIDGMVGQLRPAHVAELAEQGLTDRQALDIGFRYSAAAWTALDDGEPIAMWGITVPSLLADVAHPWGITTAGTDRHKVRFWRETRSWIARMAQIYPTLINEFDPRDAEAVRLLTRLGFTMDPTSGPFQTFRLES